MSEVADKDKRDIKRNLSIEQGNRGVFVYVIACKKNFFYNDLMSIPAKFGIPIGGKKCYDAIKDVYHVEGSGYLAIGNIPVNFKLVDNTSQWSSDIPLSLSLIKRYMSKEQKIKFSNWKSRYPQQDYKIELLQLLNIF